MSEDTPAAPPGVLRLTGHPVRWQLLNELARSDRQVRELVELVGQRQSLTNAELRVVRVIVDGKTNKEAASTLFLSPHTVDSHLRRVFGKLGINTRVELTKHFLIHETPDPTHEAA